MAHSPVMSKQEYEERKRRREVKQSDAVREQMKSRLTNKETTILKP